MLRRRAGAAEQCSGSGAAVNHSPFGFAVQKSEIFITESAMLGVSLPPPGDA